MKKIYLLLVLVSFAFVAHAQKGILSGILYDTVAKQPVASATLTVLQKKDSSLVTFTMTDSKGHFEITGLSNGEYRLLITHVNYHNAGKTFSISDADKTRDLGQVIMHNTAQTLEEVVVTAEAPPVTLIGDTVQYNAGSFKTPPNANVEQLLKKLPGVKVEKDGSIKAQGQEVKRVLVDGKEFFGNDPKVATKNLPADAIDKVQVYDKSSDQAQLTGFDDGNSEKTINLKLKKDKKKGLFGKITAGGGTNDRFEGRFNINSFKGARQLSVIGTGNNTNAEGFTFSDILSMSSVSGGRQGGNITLSSADAALAGLTGNNGNIRTIFGTGLNYNNIIGNNTEFSGNYFYNHYNPKTEKTAEQHYFLPDGNDQYRTEYSNTNNINNSHRLNMIADIRLDSFYSLKIAPSINYQQSNNSPYSRYQTLTQNNLPANEGYTDNSSTGKGYNFKNDILFRKKFRTRGRTFSLAVQTVLNANEGNAAQMTVNKFFNPDGTPRNTDSINQHNNTQSDQRSYNARAVYTEPIIKNSLLEISVANSRSKSTSDKITWDYNQFNGKYDAVNEQLTNNFENTYGFTNAGLRWRTKFRKANLAFGATWQNANLEGKIIAGAKDSLITKEFTNILPNARFQYNFSQFRNLQINYTASTNQPTISQLQPVPDITNPLDIKEGNPHLKQEYTQVATINYMSADPFRNKNFFAFFMIRQTNNKIVSYDTISALGEKRSRPVNVDGIWNINGSVSIGRPLRFLKGSLNLSTSLSYNRNKQFINGTGNAINNYVAGPDLRFDMSPVNTLDISFYTGLNYNKSNYSLQSNLNAEYLSHNYGADVNWQLPKSFFISTEFTYTVNNKMANGYNLTVPLWNASISKQVLKYNRGEIKLTAFDLLNRNVNVSRTSNQNYVEDSRITTLQRFFMLSFTYSLSKTGLAQGTGPASGIRIINR